MATPCSSDLTPPSSRAALKAMSRGRLDRNRDVRTLLRTARPKPHVLPETAFRSRQPSHLAPLQSALCRHSRKPPIPTKLCGAASRLGILLPRIRSRSTCAQSWRQCYTRWQQSARVQPQSATARKMKFWASAMVIFESVVNACEAVGGTHGRRAISDRDMRSERHGFEHRAPPWDRMGLVFCVSH